MKKTIITFELFLILLVVILFGFLLFVFTNSKIEEKDSIPVVSVDATELYCGISITSPQIAREVSFPIEVSGYVSGCSWEPYLNYVATLKIYDKNKKLIGRPYLVSKSNENNSPVSTQFYLKIQNLPINEGEVDFVFENFGIVEKTTTIPVKIVPSPIDESLS